MRKTMFVFLSLVSITLLHAQRNGAPKPKYVLSKDQAERMLDSIPTKDDKILYDEIVTTDSTQTKEQLFIRIRQWFVENFTDSKNVLEVNDKDNGLLTGKGTYKYAMLNGLNTHEGYTTFVINAAVKDGKFRYQLYNFNAEGVNTSLWATNSYGRPNIYKEKVDMDEVLKLYKSGKREKYAKKYLGDMLELVYYIKMSLADLANQKSSISDF